MRVVTRGALDLEAISAVVQTNLIRICVLVPVQVEVPQLPVTRCSQGYIKVCIRLRERNAYRVVILKIGAYLEKREIRRARANRPRTRTMASQTTRFTHTHMREGLRTARIGPCIQEGVALTVLLSSGVTIVSSPRHVHDGVDRERPVMTGKTCKRVGPGAEIVCVIVALPN